MMMTRFLETMSMCTKRERERDKEKERERAGNKCYLYQEEDDHQCCVSHYQK